MAHILFVWTIYLTKFQVVESPWENGYRKSDFFVSQEKVKLSVRSRIICHMVKMRSPFLQFPLFHSFTIISLVSTGIWVCHPRLIKLERIQYMFCNTHSHPPNNYSKETKMQIRSILKTKSLGKLVEESGIRPGFQIPKSRIYVNSTLSHF